MKPIFKVLIGVGSVIAVAKGYNYYNRSYAINTDNTNQPTDMSNYISPDYRGETSLPLGLQNNNPGNLRDSGDAWQGKAGVNGGFLTFIDLAHGIRANIINIGNLIKTYGSIQSYVSAYAPPSDGNDTTAYINAICAATGLQPSDVPPRTHDMMKAIAMAHFEMENGKSYADQYISDIDMEQALSMTPYTAGILS